MGKTHQTKGSEVRVKTASKKSVLEQLRKIPIVQVACERVGIARATFYRWKEKDKKFSKAVETALNYGTLIVNDMAESQVINGIRNGDKTYTIFWLKHHHKRYRQNEPIPDPEPQTLRIVHSVIENGNELVDKEYEVPVQVCRRKE